MIRRCCLIHLKKKFDLPPGLVELGDRHRRQVEVVGEEHQFLAVPGIAKLDPAQLAGIVPGRVEAGERDGLVAAQSG